MKMRDFVVVWLFLIASATCLQAVTYQRQEVKRLTWGKGDYQLGNNRNDFYSDDGKYIGGEGEFTGIQGPGCFEIGPHGDYYLLDPVNERLLWFNSNFEFKGKTDLQIDSAAVLAQDVNANLYVPCLPYTVNVLTPELKILGQFQFETVGAPSLTGIDYLRQTNSIVVLRNNDQYGIDLKNILEMISGRQPWGSVYAQRLNSRATKVIERKGSLATVKIMLAGFTNAVLVKIDSGNNLSKRKIEYVGRDEQNCLFLTEYISRFVGAPTQCLVHVVETSGSESSIILDTDDELFYQQRYQVKVDIKGNIYHLLQKKSGPILVKWSR